MTMKQRITVEQLNDQTDVQKERLREWWKPSEGDQALCERYGIVTIHINGDYEKGDPLWIVCDYHLRAHNPLPLLSIGQMIELIGNRIDHINSPFGSKSYIEPGEWQVWVADGFYDGADLCDALWEAVKQIL